MRQKRQSKFHPSFSTALPLFLIGCGWYSVLALSCSIEASTIATYQKAQLEIVRNTARAAQTYMLLELKQRPTALPQIEQEVLQLLVEPIRAGQTGNAWLYSPNASLFASNSGFSKTYSGKSMALMFALQRQYGAAHYEAIIQAVMQGQEGVSWYIWQPNKGIEFTPWWEPLTQDAGREIAAWTPVVIFPDTSQEKAWMIGVSTGLAELMQTTGGYTQVQTAIVSMSVMTLAILILMLLLRRSQAISAANEAHYRAIVENQMEMICRYRCDGTLTFFNQAYANTFAITSRNLKKANVFDLIPQSELPLLLLQLSTLSAQNPVHVSERLITTSNQQLRWHQWTDRAILNHRGQVVEIQSVGRDITDRKLYEAEIERLAFTDPLTGLANRRRLYDLGQQALNPTATPLPVALIYLDLDRFKPVNDTMGHEAGDELLKQVADRLCACIREEDTLARLGGDEFAILLNGSDLADAEAIATRILTALHQTFELRGQAIQLGCSLGIATTTAAVLFSQLLTQADIAMYRAKSQGRGNYVIFDAAMQAEALSRRNLEIDLRQVMSRKQLRVYYQPIVSLKSYRVLGFEAVVRWRHPQYGLLSPGEFFHIAVELGLSLQMERWVINKACRQIARWQKQHGPLPLMVSINLSGKQLVQPDFVAYLENSLQEAGLPPRTLMLEITEDIMIQQTEVALSTLTQLRQLGIQIGLDDFGTGYSSLSYLHRFPVDVLKIDRSFVTALHQDTKYSEIVRSIVMLAHSLDIRTIAEGIETRQQLSQLRRLHCNYGQGYFFAEPLSRFAVEDFLQSHDRTKLKIRP